MGNSVNGGADLCQRITRSLSYLRESKKAYNKKRAAVPKLANVAENPLAQKRMKSLSISSDRDFVSDERLFTFHPETAED